MSEKMVYYKRCFLNKPRMEQGAYIIALLSKDTYGSKEYQTYRDCSITLSDCNRIVSLDFPVDSDRETKNSISKLDKLLTTFTDFKNKLVIEAAEAKKERKLRVIQEKKEIAERKLKIKAEKKEK